MWAVTFHVSAVGKLARRRTHARRLRIVPSLFREQEIDALTFQKDCMMVIHSENMCMYRFFRNT